MSFLGRFGNSHGESSREEGEELGLLNCRITDHVHEEQTFRANTTAMDFSDPDFPGAYQQKTAMKVEPCYAPDYLVVGNSRQASIDSGNGSSNSPTSTENLDFSFPNSRHISTDSKSNEMKQQIGLMRLGNGPQTPEIVSQRTSHRTASLNKSQQQSSGYASGSTSSVFLNSREPSISTSDFQANRPEETTAGDVGIHQHAEVFESFSGRTAAVDHLDSEGAPFDSVHPVAGSLCNKRSQTTSCLAHRANEKGFVRRKMMSRLIKVHVVAYSAQEPTSLTCQVPTITTSSQLNHICKSRLFDPETVIFDATKQCGINPLYVPIFGLWNAHENNWILLSVLREVKQETLELRVRFTVKAVCEGVNACRIDEIDSVERIYPMMSNGVLKYLFYQRRHNFLRLYPIKLGCSYWLKYILSDWSEDEAKLQGDEVLVPAVFDLFRQEAEVGGKLHLTDPIKLLPNSSKESFKTSGFFNFLNKFIIRRRFQQILKLFDGLEINKPPELYYQKFITYVETMEKSFATEIFILAADIGAVSVNGDNGVVIAVESERFCEVMKEEYAAEGEEAMKLETVDDVSIMRLDFAQIAETTIVTKADDYQVFLSDILGHQIILKFSSLASSRRFVECVNGYFSILVDPCRSLSHQALLSSATEGRGVVHGPVTSQYLCHKLRNHPSNHACLYRKSQSTIGEYDVVLKVPKIEGGFTIQGSAITRDSDWRLGANILSEVPSSMMSIDDLAATLGADAHKDLVDSDVGKALTNIIPPNGRDKSSLLVHRAGKGNKDEPEEMKFPHVPEKDMGVVAGAFNTDSRLTLIREYTGGRNPCNGRKKFVSQTILLVENRSMLQQYTEAFEASLFMLFQARNHRHIVRQLGVTALNPWKVLEHSEWGSVVEYFTTRASLGRKGPDDQASITGHWLLHLFYQLAHALNYLEYKNLPHGNIRGEHILLFEVSPTPFIKLTHPGVRSTTNYGKELPVLPLPWLAGEYCNLPHTKYSLDTPQATVAADKWAFATTVCEIVKAAKTGTPLVPSCPAIATFLRETNNESINSTWERKWKEPVMKLTQMYSNSNISTFPDWLNYPDYCCPPPQSAETVPETLRRCWSLNPDRRPAFRDLLQMFALLLRHDVGQEAVLMEVAVIPAGGESSSSFFKTISVYTDAELELVKSLGKGSFGIVELCRHKGTGVQYAVKDIQVSSPTAVNNFFKEVLAMFHVKHENVVEIKALTVPTLRIVMDHVELGSLFNVLKKSEPRNYPRSDPSHLTSLSCDIAKGLRELHRLKIVHRDLALRNILVKEIAEGQYVALVSDFGYARLTEQDTYKDYSEKKLFPFRWYPPESIKLSHSGSTIFSFKSDIWSFGVTVWEVFEPDSSDLLRKTLSEDWNKLYSQLASGVRLGKPRLMPEEVFSVVKKCWEFREEDRIDLDNIARLLQRVV